jgi:hypothetical protein
MGRNKVLEKEEVLEALKSRDHRQLPAVTTTQIAEEFSETSRKTVERRLNDLVDDGDVYKRKLANVTIFWSKAPASCAQCGSDLERLDEIQLGCRTCDSLFDQTRGPDGPKDVTIIRHEMSQIAIWWLTLPDWVKRLVVGVAALAGPLRSERFTEYRPDQISFDHETEEVYIDRDDVEELKDQGDGEDTQDEDDERRLVIGQTGDGLAVSKD